MVLRIAPTLFMSWFLFFPKMSSADYPSCAPGLTCSKITPSNHPNMHFDCAYVQPANARALVYHMHGNDGPRSKGMFFDLMLQLSEAGFSSLACDQRGYSPEASPNEMPEYYYDKLVGDIFSIVNASGLNQDPEGKFHLVAHDQGARVGWHAIGLGEGRRRFLSFSSLSIPHSDVFSDALYGPSADSDQQAAVQYVRMFILPNSTTVYNDAILNTVCKSFSHLDQPSCQRSLWWYNGAIDSGAEALAPLGPYGYVPKFIGIPPDVLANMTQYPLDGVPQTVKVGYVKEFPVLFSCGAGDGSDLCKPKFGDQSGKLIEKFKYLRMDAPCSHNILKCPDAAQVQQLQDAIVANIQSVYE